MRRCIVTARRRDDALGIIETVYDFHGDDRAWIARVAEATEAAVGTGCGTIGLLYETNASNVMHACAVAETKAARGYGRLAKQVVEEGVDAAYVETSFRVIPCGMSSETPGVERTSFGRLFNPKGVRDMIGINGVDPAGSSAFIGVCTPRPLKLAPGRREMLTRVSAHMAAGYRLRRRLRNVSDEGEAVLTPSGRVEHAVGDAQLRAARELLGEATRAIERARMRMRRDSPEEAIATWRSLVSARWSLVDHFERDGKRFVVAQRNEVGGVGPGALSPRERQVVALVAIGHTTKLIAYELGLAPATIRVVIKSCCAKLGARDRQDLIAMLTPRDS
jgi:DNA-binding CsgD family transcriptional regulator